MATATAVPNWQSNVSMVTEQQFSNLTDKEMDAIWHNESPVDDVLAQFFETVSAPTKVFKISSVSNELELPVESEDGGTKPFTVPVQGRSKEFTCVNYRRFLKATDDFRRVDRFNDARSLMQGLGTLPRRFKAYTFAWVFDNSFANVIGPDGMYLCDTDHPPMDGRAAVQDNLETGGALTPTRFSTARVNMRKRKGPRGHPHPVYPRYLVTVPDNEEMTRRIVNSEKLPGTAQNDDNWNQGVVQPVISEYITLSNNPWWVIGNLEGKARGLVYVEFVAPNLKPYNDDDPDVIWGRRLKMSFDVGFIHWRNIQGNAGA